ncbi:MAG: winged helix-turn-helix transcriptional regulator [Candidatus Freyarchaeota archaeon]
MDELENIKNFLGMEPLKTVQNPEKLPLEEQFQLFLPDILPQEEKQLLTRFLIYKYRGEKREGEKEEEERFRDLIRADTIMGEEFIPSLISTLKQLDRYMRLGGETSLTSEQLRQILQDMVYDYRVKLDARDLKILDRMGRSPFITIKEIAEETNTSYTTIQRRRKMLEERCRLGIYPRINYPHIGLINMLLLVEGEAQVQSPYLLSRQELYGGISLYTFFSMAVPPKAVNPVYREFEKRAPRLWTWIIDSFESSFSPDFYDVDEGDWKIDWKAWSLYLSNVLSRGWSRALPPEEVGRMRPPTSPPEKAGGVAIRELRLIDALSRNFNAAIEDLCRGLGCNARTIIRTRERLLRRGTIQLSLGIDQIGLNEHILFIVESHPDTLHSFAAALRRLPKAWIYWARNLNGEGEALVCWLEAPPGSITPLERAVRRRLLPLAKYKLFFRSHQEGSRIPLLELFDVQTRAWRWSPEMLKITLGRTG